MINFRTRLMDEGFQKIKLNRTEVEKRHCCWRLALSCIAKHDRSTVLQISLPGSATDEQRIWIGEQMQRTGDKFAQSLVMSLDPTLKPVMFTFSYTSFLTLKKPLLCSHLLSSKLPEGC